MSRLIHLNGPPGVGKSTLARRYAAQHPGVLLLEIDTLRTMVAGWQEDFYEAGARIRTAALAAIQAYLASGHDVVLPQLIGRSDELARFRAAGTQGGGQYVGVVLVAESDEVIARFRGRAATEGDDPWVRAVTTVVADLGGDEALRRSSLDLEALAAREDLLRLPSTDLEATYAALLLALGEQS